MKWLKKIFNKHKVTLKSTCGEKTANEQEMKLTTNKYDVSPPTLDILKHNPHPVLKNLSMLKKKFIMTLRQMTMDDADFMLELKNYPETIQHSILTEEQITKEAHYKWLPDNLQYFQVIMEEDDMLGAIRIQDYEVSIWIQKKYWKLGIATYALQTFCKRGMTAKIVDENIASMKAFIRAGFEPQSYNNGYYIFKKY